MHTAMVLTVFRLIFAVISTIYTFFTCYICLPADAGKSVDRIAGPDCKASDRKIRKKCS